ncbi:MAG: response regulator transcription factor [Chloroflexi bacterium]|nr:response regulator transcription factor [Chloroflexota bacterium]
MLVDIHMPGMNGIETIAALKQHYPAMRTIALTHSEEDETVVKAVEAGATGYLQKTAEITAIADAIRAAAAGKRSLSPDIAEALYLSVSTVKFHVGVIFRKLGATTRTEAVVMAFARALVQSKDS